MTKEQYIKEIIELLMNCNEETIISINHLNHILVELSAGQLEYIIELTSLLFGQSSK